MNNSFQNGNTANFSEFSTDLGIDADLEQDRTTFRDSGEEDTLIGVEELIGTSNNDRISGGDEDNTIQGNGGNDFIEGQLGDDILQGGEGNDFLIGGSGNDNSDGGDGDDLLAADSGSDNLSGGEGSDRFIYYGSRYVASIDELEVFGTDRILDFERGVDRIELYGFNTSFEELDSDGDQILTVNDSSISSSGSGLSIDFSDEFGNGSNVITIDNISSLDSSDLNYRN